MTFCICLINPESSIHTESEAKALSRMDIKEFGFHNEKSSILEKVSKRIIDVVFSVYRQKLKIVRVCVLSLIQSLLLSFISSFLTSHHHYI